MIYHKEKANVSAQRYSPDIKMGLNTRQVEKRMKDGFYNADSTVPTKTIPQIITGNLCTLFNFLNIGLAAAVILVGSYKNVLFMGVVISNLLIGIFQEIRSKLTVDKLSIIASAKASVIRDGEEKKIEIDEIVLDDIIVLESGRQIAVDCIILDGSCDVNESFVTGESDAVYKQAGDMLLGGSFVVSGNCFARAERVGKDSYASKISSGAKYLKKVNSEIMRTLKKIIKFMSIFIVPVGLILMYNQLGLEQCTIESAVVQTVAAIISMIPEGLMLLASTVLAVGVLRLSRYKVLVQELYCIETLARVDTLCLDKTGTLTEGCMEVTGTIVLDEKYKDDIEDAMASVASALNDNNPTFDAVKEAYGDRKTDWIPLKICPFSSQTKWSGAFFEGKGSYIIGASEFILKDMDEKLKKQLKEIARENRVVLLAHSSLSCGDKLLPEKLVPVAFILLRDKIRKEAKDTLEYFAGQGVDIKVISGDSVETVSGIAKSTGVKGWNKAVDASSLDDEDLKAAASEYVVFGRVTPVQKKELVMALQKEGHTVAMTGDGVNDVLALKEADCSIAMASGTDAARNVSQLVLLNSNFDSMPKVVAEGRRSINNIQRSASIVMVRTIYAMVLAVIFLFVILPYPFEPIQQTLINVVSSGIPGIILALEPNKNRIRGNFLHNIMKLAIPPAVSIALCVILILCTGQIFGIQQKEVSTVCVYVTGFIRLMFLFRVCMPFNRLRSVLFAFMVGIFVGNILLFPELFSLASFTLNVIVISSLYIALSVAVFVLITKVFEHVYEDNTQRVS